METARETLTAEQLFQKLEAALSCIALPGETVREIEQARVLLEALVRIPGIKSYGSSAEPLSEAQSKLPELEPRACAAGVAAEAALDPADKVLGDIPPGNSSRRGRRPSPQRCRHCKDPHPTRTSARGKVLHCRLGFARPR